MKDLAVQIRSFRRQRKLSQQEMATRAGISLATLQNVEAGNANPSWSTLSALAEILGLYIRLIPRALAWDQLAHLGCPVSEQGEGNFITRPTREELIQVFNGFNPPKVAASSSREWSALYAFGAAIESHYPSVWKEINPAFVNWFGRQKTVPSPKLRRLALQRLGSYL